MCRLEEIIPEMSKYRKVISSQLERAIRATLSVIEEQFSLEKYGVVSQDEIKQNLMKLKLYADSLRQANAYLKEKGFQNEEEFDQQITTIADELNDSGRILQERMQQYDNSCRIIDNDLKKLKEIQTKYRDLNTGGNFLFKRPSQAATDYLSEHRFTSIEEVNEKEKKGVEYQEKNERKLE